MLAGRTKQVLASLFFTLFPADCSICGAPLLQISRLPVCDACLTEMRPLSGCYCGICGAALHSPAFLDEGEAVCGLCQRVHPPYERAAAYGSYAGGLRDLIHLLKYSQVRPAARVLGRMAAETIDSLRAEIPGGKIVVVPVPLHGRKRAARGFNQSELIAAAALKHLAQPDRFELAVAVLQRQRETASQIGLTAHQRRENLRGAFRVTDEKTIAGRDVLLVDDVFTTGTTASECARVLRRAGAAKVWVVTVARTLKATDMFAVPEASLEEAESVVAAAGEGNEERLTKAAHG
jgi:ComF family protein